MRASEGKAEGPTKVVGLLGVPVDADEVDSRGVVGEVLVVLVERGDCTGGGTESSLGLCPWQLATQTSGERDGETAHRWACTTS